MAPRKRSNVLTTEQEQKSDRRKKIKTDDSSDKKEYKTSSKKKAVAQLPADGNAEFPDKDLAVAKSSAKRTPQKSPQKKNKAEVAKKKLENMSVEEMNVEQLLALGEKSQELDFSSSKVDDWENSSDSDISDFEEVKNNDVVEPVIPKEGVNITLEGPNLFHKHKKKAFDWEAHVKRQMNRVRKEIQLLMHKVHVLCWIAHVRYVNNTLNNPILMESCTALIKSKNLYPSKYADLNYLEGILKWFHKNIELKKDGMDPLCTGGLLEELKYQIEKKETYTSRTFIFIFIILLRILGLKARVVISFQVLPVKPSLLELYGDVIKARSEKLKKSVDNPGISVERNESEKPRPLAKKPKESAGQKSTKRKSASAKPSDQKKKSKGEEVDDTTMKQEVNNSDDDFISDHIRPTTKSSRKSLKLEPAAEKSGGPQTSSKAKSKESKVGPKKEIISKVKNYEDDNVFKSVSLIKKTNKKKIERKSESSEESQKKREGSDVWTEVYLEAEEKWICVDVPRQKIHCVGEIYLRTTHPVAYIVACNNDHTLKDVTKRYVPNWHSDTRKKRVDEEWWNQTMRPYLPPRTAQDKEEDEDINRQLVDKPLPSSISEFKDHPLYVLKRHLLKFEAIYPPDAPTLGFVRGEPVYARECVHTLHSREMWYKQARLVRVKEEPYKIVKARPKYDKMTGEVKKDLPLELFGNWQTEDYIPPVATDGKVPRNEYGNVDLFKPCMLPIGTVHLQIPALNRIAKKLDIDCAPATVGFDFHSGGSHPVFDGFVVCEEYKDVLLDAWNKEIDESSKRESEKREKRVYGNWRRLIRGLLIREKLKIKYAFGENSDDEDVSKSVASTPSTSKQIKTK